MASSLISTCRFNPTLGGATDWTYSSAVVGYNSPALAGAVNAATYSYRAESNDLLQWEEGIGAYNSATGVFARSVVFYNSSGTGVATGQSGAGTKITFSTVPQVAIVALAEDLFLFNAAMSLTTAQKKQALANIFIPPTTQIFLSGSGTWTPSAGCLWAEVLLVGAAAGNSGSGTGGAWTVGSAGGNTTLGGTLLVAGGGSAGQGPGNGAGGAGGVPSSTAGPIILLAVSGGSGSAALNGGGTYPSGVAGANSSLAGAGAGGSANSVGSAPAANSGSSGGGSSAINAAGSIAGSIGGAGATVRAIIVSPTALAYAVGAGGASGAAGTSGNIGLAGASGQIVIVEHYN